MQKTTIDKKRIKSAKKTSQAVSRFIDEGNPNIQPVEKTEESSLSAQSSGLPEKEDKGNDPQLAREIRKAIEKDDAVATMLRNIKIKVKNGNVSLTGMVFSQQERMSIVDKASSIAGFGKVDSRLEVVDEMP